MGAQSKAGTPWRAPRSRAANNHSGSPQGLRAEPAPARGSACRARSLPTRVTPTPSTQPGASQAPGHLVFHAPCAQVAQALPAAAENMQAEPVAC